jgi:aspartyl-tRNA(Asn)/glutamyl-tRNA(Gln) amidotransferase subunit B
MEKGHLRCDANVSVRLKGAEKFGTKAEVKNLNSFRFLKQALDFEIARQVALLESGERVVQETRLYNPDLGETFAMRSKEDAHDYRYFPEPDLVPLRIGSDWLDRVRSTMPELPSKKRARFTRELRLSDYDADVLTASRGVSEYFETVARVSGSAKLAANWVMGDLMAALKNGEAPISAENLGQLVQMIATGELSGKLAKEIFPKMIATGESAAAIAEREGLKQIADTGALEQIVAQVIEANPKQVEQYRSGKTTVINFLVGQVMKASRGQAKPDVVTELLKQKLC